MLLQILKVFKNFGVPKFIRIKILEAEYYVEMPLHWKLLFRKEYERKIFGNFKPFIGCEKKIYTVYYDTCGIVNDILELVGESGRYDGFPINWSKQGLLVLNNSDWTTKYVSCDVFVENTEICYSGMKSLCDTLLSLDIDWAPINRTIIYTDGACSGNGKVNAVGGYGFYVPQFNHKAYGKLPPYKYKYSRELVRIGDEKITNIRAEYMAVIKALLYCLQKNIYFVELMIDLQLVVKTSTIWMYTWERKGLFVNNYEGKKNLDLVKIIYHLRHIINIKFTYCKAHSGIIGNEIADKLAVAGKSLKNYDMITNF